MADIRLLLSEAIEDDPTLVKTPAKEPSQEPLDNASSKLENEYDLVEELIDGSIIEHEYDMVEEWDEIRAPPLDEVLANINKMCETKPRGKR